MTFPLLRLWFAPMGLLLALTLLVPASGHSKKPELSGADLFVIANTQYTVLHEVGHVIISELHVPFLGKEEDAADELATVAILRSKAAGSGVAERLLAAADGWLLEWQQHVPSRNTEDYWDVHSLDIQRYYNINCLVYGSNPEAFETWLESAEIPLPYPRAWRCGGEYRRAARSLDWIATTLRAPAQQARRGQTGRVGVIYEPPATPEREVIEKLFRKTRALEQTARIIESQFQLPYDIDIVLTNICGPTAYWRPDLKEIVVCYKLVEHFTELAPKWPCATPRSALKSQQLRNSCAAVPRAP